MNFQLKLVFLALFIAFGIGKGAVKSAPQVSSSQSLIVREEQNQVLMTWNGSVEPPMKQKFEDAFRALGDVPHRVLISFNSPGGRVDHGHEVIEVIRGASRKHFVNTSVEAGKVCASMCVPLYLTGMERYASPTAHFMFHEVILKLKPEGERAVREMQRYAPQLVADARKQAVAQHTDRLFEDEFESKLDNRWLDRMRERIKGRDVWLSGRQLVEEKSGVIDKLR